MCIREVHEKALVNISMYQNLSKVIVIVIAVYGLLHEISAIITWPLDRQTDRHNFISLC